MPILFQVRLWWIKGGLFMKHERHHSKSDSKLKQAVCIITSFLLAVSLTIIVLCTALKIGFINQDKIIQGFSDSGYYISIYNNMLERCENEALVSGLSEEIFDGVFSIDELASYCDTYIMSLINNQKHEMDTSAMETKLSENIKNYAEEHNLVVDGDIDEVIASFTSAVISYYKSAVQFPYFDQISSLFRLFNRLLTYLMPCMIIFSLILVILIVRLNTFKKNRIFRYLSYAFLSSSLSILVIPIFSYITKFYKRLIFSEEHEYKYIVAYIDNGLRIFVIIGIGLFVLGILSILNGAIIKKKLKEEHVPVHHHDEQ